MMRVEKDAIKATVHIEKYRLEGYVYMHPRTRFSDYLNLQHNSFVIMTDISIYQEGETTLFKKVKFLGVHRSSIHMIYPDEDAI